MKKKRVYGRVHEVFYKIWDSNENPTIIYTSSRGYDRGKVVNGVAFSYWKPQGIILGGKYSRKFGIVDVDRYSNTTASDTSAIAWAIHEGPDVRFNVPVLHGVVDDIIELLGYKGDAEKLAKAGEEFKKAREDVELLYANDTYIADEWAIRIHDYSKEDGDMLIIAYTDPNAPKELKGRRIYIIKLTERELRELGYDIDAIAGNLTSVGVQPVIEELLTPEVAKLSKKAGNGYIRQGDLYFIPTKFTTRELKKKAVLYWKRKIVGKDRWAGRARYDYDELIDRLDEVGDNLDFKMHVHDLLRMMDSHYPRELIITKDGHVYARGSVIHQNGEHKTVNLGNCWHLVKKQNLDEKVEGHVIGFDRGGGILD